MVVRDELIDGGINGWWNVVLRGHKVKCKLAVALWCVDVGNFVMVLVSRQHMRGS